MRRGEEGKGGVRRGGEERRGRGGEGRGRRGKKGRGGRVEGRGRRERREEKRSEGPVLSLRFQGEVVR